MQPPPFPMFGGQPQQQQQTAYSSYPQPPPQPYQQQPPAPQQPQYPPPPPHQQHQAYTAPPQLQGYPQQEAPQLQGYPQQEQPPQPYTPPQQVPLSPFVQQQQLQQQQPQEQLPPTVVQPRQQQTYPQPHYNTPNTYPQQPPQPQMQGYPPQLQQQQQQQQQQGYIAPPQLPQQPQLQPQQGYPTQQQQQGYSQPPPPQQQQQQQPSSGTSGGPSFSSYNNQQAGQSGSFSQQISTPNTPAPGAQQQGSPHQNAPPGTPSLPPNQRPQRARQAVTNRRIDPSQVPSPCRDLPQDTAGTSRPRYATSKACPPLSITNFVALDDGNANPKCFRPTISCVPHEESFVKESGVPFAAVVAPLSHLQPEEAIPIVTGRPPVRCKRCRAYINSHTPFTQLGRTWVCCFCEMNNEVSTEYFCNLDGNNRRRDVMEKYELSKGSVEFDVQGIEEYAAKNDKGEVMLSRPMDHLFALDISFRPQHRSSNALQDLADSIRNSIHQMDPKCRVSFFTYASTLHFYNFKHPQVPQLLVADIENPFVPIPFNLLCWLSVGEDIVAIEAFLDRLVALSEASEEDDSCIGAAVKVANLILAETGGRVIITGHKVPSIGAGAITKPREQHKIYGTEKEKDLLRPIDGFWTSTALESAKRQVSFDLMMFSDAYCELVTLGQLCHMTNGAQHLFINYNGMEDRPRLQAAVDASLLMEAGYGAILRVRCSNGLRVKGYRGHFLSQDPHDMDLATVQGSSTFLVDLVHEGKLDIKSAAFFQCAMLYTTRSGARRVRVHTLRLPVSNTYANLYKNCDLEANLFATVHECIFDAVNKGPKQARALATERVAKLLTSYRKYCSAGSRGTQLLMPEMLKLLPVYTLCTLKSDALTVGTSTRIDERVQCIHDLMTMPSHRLLQYIYPRMFAVHNLLGHPTAGTLNPVTQLCHLPTLQQLTCEVVMSHGVYVLHDQQAKLVYLWIGSQVVPKVSQILFGTEDCASVGRTVYMESFHERLRNVLHAVMLNDTGSMDRLLIVHERDAAEEAFFRNMLEDESLPGSQSYSDLLCYLHAQINARLS